MVKIFRNINLKLLASILIIFFIISTVNFSIIADAGNNDLSINSIKWEGTIKEEKKTVFVVKIENDGNENITTDIKISLYVDNKLTASNITSDDLNIGEIDYLNLSWTPSFGDDELHQLKFVLNNDFNNLKEYWVVIYEKDTTLEIIKMELDEKAYINETIQINTSVINNGASTDEIITARLNSSVKGEIEVLEKEGLNRDETYNFKFNWTPTEIGVQKLTLFVYLDDDLHDKLEKNVNVTITEYEWWNENWHYRYLISLKGEGNYSQSLNFTKILNDLNVKLKDFENTTIRIIEYSSNGLPIDIVENYSFIESKGFNKTRNATGALKWRVSSGSNIKNYAIYFDVKANIGIRNSLNEVNIGNISENVLVYSNERYEGWWAELEYPVGDDNILTGDPLNISVITKAKVMELTGIVYNNEDKSLSYPLNFIDTGNNTNWYNNSLNISKEGNWTINITSFDNANYYYNFSSVFYVGQTDLDLVDIDITIADNVSYTSFHRNDTLNITAYVETLFASVKNVRVSLTIFDSEDNVVVKKSSIVSVFIKDKKTKLVFSWFANITGDFNVVVNVDSDDNVSERDETNNKMEEEITVYEWPDLLVEDIILPKKDITEFDEVKITAKIKNRGSSYAENYKVGLFMEKKIGEDPSMSYTDLVYTAYISVKKNSTIKKDLFWDSAEPGDWTVGVKIFWSESKYDLFQLNNMLSSNEFLHVDPVESDKPIIKNVKVSPSSLVQKDLVIITADVYDDSGLKKVDINITDPLDGTYISSMIKTDENSFKYSFSKTGEIGEYDFVITAIDNTPKNNFKTYKGEFDVRKDNVDPVISYFGADPIVQKREGYITISCIVSDNIGISDVEARIVTPEGFSYNEELDLKEERYVYKDIYTISGKYSFFITTTDISGNIEISGKKYFWITDDLNDYDSDGIPNNWENKYNLDSFNSSDADIDSDDDGYTNLEEYKMNTNPRENILIQNMASNIRENIWYLISSVIVFLIIIVLSIYAKRRIYE